jgi:DNA-binding NarL/FixJ family response regulator
MSNEIEPSCLLIVDDEPLYRIFFAQALRRRWPATQVLEEEYLENALESMRSPLLALILADLELQQNYKHGLMLVQAALDEIPAVPILIVSRHDHDIVLMRIPHFPNVRGFVAKRELVDAGEVARAVAVILQGRYYYSNSLMRRMHRLSDHAHMETESDEPWTEDGPPLGRREEQVFELIGRYNLSNPNIAKVLETTAKAVEKTVTRLLRKYQAMNRTQLRLEWIRHHNQKQ